MKACVALLLLLALSSACSSPHKRTEVLTDSGSASPFIDSIKQGLKPEAETSSAEPDPYLQSIKSKLKVRDQAEGYSEREKAKLKDQASTEGYSEKEKAKVEAREEGGAIAALNEGRSELHAVRKGEAHQEFGLRVGSVLSRSVSAPQGVQLQSFTNIYGTALHPDFDFFYDREIIPHFGPGKLSIQGILGVSYFDGNGTFAIPSLSFGFAPRDAADPTKTSLPVGSVSQTRFQFLIIPLIAEVNYSFPLGKYFRPFVNAGPAVIPYAEVRLDKGHGNKGYSFGLMESAGISLMLDWIQGSRASDLYYEHGVKHYYLNIEYSNLSSFEGDVSIATQGLFAGLSFEY